MIAFHNIQNIFTSSKLNDSTIFSGSSTKLLGDSRNDETLLEFFKNHYPQYVTIVRPKQTHSTRISIIHKSDSRVLKLPDCDGLITQEKNIILTVQTADCVPLIFADKKNGVVGVSHQGWKGTLRRMAQKMVHTMISQGAEKEYLRVMIGPAIGSCCYEVYGERVEMFEAEFGGFLSKKSLLKSYHFTDGSECNLMLEPQTRLSEWVPSFLESRNSKTYLNLSLLNYLQLLEVGIKKANIDFLPFCTKCNEGKFYSYQRDTRETFGEMFHFVGLA